MSKLLIQTAAVGMLALPLQAQEITYSAASLNYEAYAQDGSDEDLGITALNGAMEYENSNFVIGLEAHWQNYNGDEFFLENARRWGASVAYAVNPEILVGAEYNAITSDYGDFEDELTSTSVFAQYVTEKFGVAISNRKLDYDFGDESFTSVFAEGHFAEMFTIGAVVEEVPFLDEMAYHLSADVSSGPWSGRGFYTSVTGAEYSYYGLRAAYAFGSGLSVNAGYDSSQDSFFSDFSSRSVGAEYQVNDAVSVGASFTQYDSSFGNDVQSFGVSVDYLMGSSKRLDNRMYDAASEDLEQSPLIGYPDFGFGLLYGFLTPV